MQILRRESERHETTARLDRWSHGRPYREGPDVLRSSASVAARAHNVEVLTP